MSSDRSMTQHIISGLCPYIKNKKLKLRNTVIIFSQYFPIKKKIVGTNFHEKEELKSTAWESKSLDFN